MAEVTADVEAFCLNCSNALTTRKLSHGAIDVEPCETCLQKARDEAVEDHVNNAGDVP